MTRFELIAIANSQLLPDDSYVETMTRFDGGVNLIVRDKDDHKVIIEVDLTGKCMGRTLMEGESKPRARKEAVTTAAKRGETLFDPNLYTTR
jgi:hypothetical protein